MDFSNNKIGKIIFASNLSDKLNGLQNCIPNISWGINFFWYGDGIILAMRAKIKQLNEKSKPRVERFPTANT